MAKSPVPAHDAGRWVPCPGSVMMRTLYPPIETNARNEDREEGKAFHHLAAEMLTRFIKGDATQSRDELVGTVTGNGVMIDDTMYQSAVDYTTDVFKYCNQWGCLRDVEIERPLSMDWLNPGDKAFPDVMIVNRKAAEIVIWEGKYGHSVVEAFENWQLLLYAEAIMRELNPNGDFPDDHWTLRLRVYQPRAHHPDGPSREWVVRASDIRAHINVALNRAEEAMRHDARCQAGPWCAGCSGRRGCPTLQRTVYNAIDYAGSVDLGGEMSSDSLSLELQILRRAKRLIAARLDGLEEQAQHEILRGKQLPGFGVKQTMSRFDWKRDVPTEQIVMLGDLYGVDLRKPTEVITPKQAENKGIDEAVISEYASRYPTGYKLVEDDGSKARQAFRK